MSDTKVPKKQKTYSLPQTIADWLHNLFEQNKDDLALIGITSETKLLEVLARNGEQGVSEVLTDLKARRKARQATPQK